MVKIRFSATLLIVLMSVLLHAQGNTVANDSIKYNSLDEGNYFFSIGTNLGTNTSKNRDDFIFYTIDEKNSNFNIKLGFGHYIKDNTPIGFGFRYKNFKTDLVYENTTSDTIHYIEKENQYVSNIFYGITKSLFNSKRVFFISDPSIIFGIGNLKAERTLDESTEFSKSTKYDVAIGLNVGLMVFLWPNMSAQFNLGPIGAGYQWEDFYLNGEPNGTASDFFIRMSPDLFSFEFSISKYFK